MTDILCRWLNQDVHLDKTITIDSFADDLSSGYLIGKVLHSHGLQSDFSSFSKGKSSEAKLSNFMKLESSLRLLDIPFDSNLIHSIMSGHKGSATKLMYQIYVALNRKGSLTGQSLERNRAPAKTKQDTIQKGIFTKLLKQQTPRQVDLNFQQLVEKFQEKQKEREEFLVIQDQKEEEKLAEQRKKSCQEAIFKQRTTREKQSEMYSHLKPIDVPKTTTQKRKSHSGNKRMNTKVAMETIANIDAFEANLSERRAITVEGNRSNESHTKDSSDCMEIKRDRDSRRRKVLMSQIQAIHEQEERNREQMLSERLKRQCLQEKRIATQLMQIRKEKDNIRNNRILRLKQFQEERNKEFLLFLEREAIEARRIKEEQQALYKARQVTRKQLLQAKAKQNYNKHYTICQNILHQIIELVTKVVEYRKLTLNMIPAKLMRDWKTLFLVGKSLCGDSSEGSSDGVIGVGGGEESVSGGSSDDIRDCDEILNDVDIQEYLKMINDWSIKDSTFTPSPNVILTHIVHRLLELVHPPKVSANPPPFPKFYIKGAFIGLPFTGKSSILQQLSTKYGIHVISPTALVKQALDTYTSEISVAPANDDTTESDTEVITIVVTDTEDTLPNDLPIELTELGTLGEQVYNAINNGDSVDDETLIDIIMYEIKNLEEGTGWILDNFPTTEEQASLLTIGLTGQEANDLLEQSAATKLRTQSFLLIPEREIKEEELLNLSAVCGIDIVIHFSSTPDSVFKRSVLQKEDIVGKPDMQQCLLTFEAQWPKLKKWYQKYRTLHTVDANKDYDDLFIDVEKLIESKLTKAKEIETMKKFGLQIHENLVISRSVSRMGQLDKSPSTIAPTKTLKPPPPGDKTKRPLSAGSSRKSSKSKNANKKQQQIQTAESELFHLLEVNVEPGEQGWPYCDLTVNTELVSSLAERWPKAEKMFVMMFCDVFRSLRQERDYIHHYIYNKRTEFSYYLKRSDAKLPVLTKWQREYNSISTELRQQDLMKAELHQRVDDLSEQLWEICDTRKTESENERQSIKDDQWLPDHIGIITNYYISLMQAELTKFQDAVLLLKDYYISMLDIIPQSLPDINSRLPLIELPMYIAPVNNNDKDNSVEEQDGVADTKTENQLTQNEDSEENTKCIPLIPRESPAFPDASAADETTKSKKKSTVEAPPTHSPLAEDFTGLHLDHQLIVHAYNTALSLSFKMLRIEFRLIEEAAAEAEKPPPTATPPVQETKPKEQQQKSAGKKSPAAAKKGKGTPAKGKKSEPEKSESPVPVAPATAVPTPQQLARKQKLELMRKEHKAALKHEEKMLNGRLMLIKMKALEFIDYIKDKVNKTYDEMEQWIIVYYQHEIESVSQLCEVLHCAIEQETKLLSELTFHSTTFNIDQSINFYHPSPPLSPLPPQETLHHIHFTTNQLLSLISHIRLATSTNTMSTESLTNVMESLINKTIGQNVFPNMWKDLTHEQIQSIIDTIYGKTIDLIDWRQLVLCLTQPYPIPAINDLLLAQQYYSSTLNTTTTSSIDRETYNRTTIWLDESVNEERDRKIKMLFFELFKDVTSDKVNYREMLLFVCANPNINEGFLNALSLVLNQPLTHDSTVEIPSEVMEKVLTHGLVTDGLHNVQDIYSNISKGIEHTSCNSLPLNILMENPLFVKLISNCNQYHLPDIPMLLVSRASSTEPSTE